VSADNEWDKMRKAHEDGFFVKKNDEAMLRLKDRMSVNSVRKSPITGEPMTQETLMGVIIDRCPTSGGIWLDAGELELIIEYAKADDSGKGANIVSEFFGLFKKN
jgi:hypothetical protein